MADPYETLGLPSNADEQALRKRYLELVRQHPPHRSPQRFAEIRAAYDELRDPWKRMESLLFEPPRDTLGDVSEALRASLRSARIPTETLLSLAEQ